MNGVIKVWASDSLLSFQSSLLTDKDKKKTRLRWANELFAKVSCVKYLYFSVNCSNRKIKLTIQSKITSYCLNATVKFSLETPANQTCVKHNHEPTSWKMSQRRHCMYSFLHFLFVTINWQTLSVFMSTVPINMNTNVKKMEALSVLPPLSLLSWSYLLLCELRDSFVDEKWCKEAETPLAKALRSSWDRDGCGNAAVLRRKWKKRSEPAPFFFLDPGKNERAAVH